MLIIIINVFRLECTLYSIYMSIHIYLPILIEKDKLQLPILVFNYSITTILSTIYNLLFHGSILKCVLSLY